MRWEKSMTDSHVGPAETKKIKRDKEKWQEDRLMGGGERERE